MKRVNIYLGPVIALASRTLIITRQHRAGDDAAPSAEHSADAGAVENVSVNLPSNTIWQATLADVLSSGESPPLKVLNFHTGELQYNGPVSDDGLFRVVSMEDLSSSSSSSSQSSSSSSSSSSQSSSSSSS
jgi:hypothetical protein